MARRQRWSLPSTPSEDRPRAEPRTPQPTPEERVLSTEAVARIGDAVDRLPERQRAVFTLCHVAELSARDVGQSLGLSEATVRVHLFRAIRRLRTLLTPLGASS